MTTKAETESKEIPLRPPETVMRLDRMGSLHQSRLSFMRALLRMMKRERWEFSRPVWRINDSGVGVAVYQAKGPERIYSLVAFSHDLAPEKRSDRSIATEWDATFAMFDGVPTEDDLERLSKQVPLQEAGRVSQSELSISRANKSVRLFNHVVDSLAEGRQPASEQIESIGYLMRTTAVYGSAKFGAASRDKIKGRPELSRPFHLEMLSVYLTRAFTVDLAEHLAQAKSPETAVAMEQTIRRRLGVGNSTGLGMAPYLINHPPLIHNWVMARETALARVRSVSRATAEEVAAFQEALSRATSSVGQWTTGDTTQTERIAVLREELGKLDAKVDAFVFSEDQPWNRLYDWAADNLSLEAQELLVSLLLEPYGELVDELLDTMSADEEAEFRLNGLMTVGELRSILEKRYAWAIETDYSLGENHARFWYISSNKAEPRLGERAEEPDAEMYEEPLDIGRGVANLARQLTTYANDELIAEFLLQCPEFRRLVRRVQIIDRHPYGEVYDNLISASLRPLDMLRWKLSFFGAIDFDPRSDRWTRINMYKNAPYPEELQSSFRDNWPYYPMGDAS